MGHGAMLSGRLVEMVEDHADQLTQALVAELRQEPRALAYQRLSYADIYERVYSVYHDLGEWLGREAENLVEQQYSTLGKRRASEGIPLSQVVYVLIRTKTYLFEYVRRAGLFDSVMDLYQLQEFHRLVENFFDRAVYYAALGYERASALSSAAVAS